MIDNKLIGEIATQCLQQLAHCRATPSPALWCIDNFLPCTALAKLQKFVKDPDMEWSAVDGQSLLPRQRISWQIDSIIEEIYEAWSTLTPIITERISHRAENFWGISLWRDQPGYTIGWHTDNVNIDVSMQLYLFDEYQLPGTDFLIDHNVYSVPFQNNCGYIVDNAADKRLTHKIAYEVPANTIRYSLYAIWSRFPKHVADT